LITIMEEKAMSEAEEKKEATVEDVKERAELASEIAGLLAARLGDRIWDAGSVLKAAAALLQVSV
jgi:hypothetical protein